MDNGKKNYKQIYDILAFEGDSFLIPKNSKLLQCMKHFFSISSWDHRKFGTPSDSYQMSIWAILAVVWFFGKLGAQVTILIGKILFITPEILKWSEVRTFVVLFSTCLGTMQGLSMQKHNNVKEKTNSVQYNTQTLLQIMPLLSPLIPSMA